MTAKDIVAIKRALISVSDKTGVADFARRLAAAGVELISTGGTARTLREAGLEVADVAEVTQFPEMMDGRVKTLHPAIHGALLARRDKPDHMQALEAQAFAPIDLLVVNLYPFAETVARGADYEACVENIDIGGPAMLRAAAKNHASVAVVVDSGDYDRIAEALAASGGVDYAMRQRLAAKAYQHTAAYDAAIGGWFAQTLDQAAPAQFAVAGDLRQTLRYGENPHQTAAVYVTDRDAPGIVNARQLQGKELSYNNFNDANAAFELLSELGDEAPAVVIVKHANPCGVARGDSLAAAYEAALRCDPVSAFGGIVALSRAIDAETATRITRIFTEVIIAPGVMDEARRIFAAKKNLRVLTTSRLGDAAREGCMLATIAGGFLVQSRDNRRLRPEELKIVTQRRPGAAELDDMVFAFTIAKHVKSNAIVYVKDGAAVGVGAGQMSRIDSARIAALKAEEAAAAAGLPESLAKGSVVASDAFFPFPDGLLAAARAGATAVIQPGGSIRDEEVIEAADEAGLAMAFTGVRHFRH